ncbi:nucleotidyltransferase domain-containing protein [Desulfobotulus sp. H1]|uniref:Nucleotidyltransferase domain-containing protein n=1 Tax=Desulfobotulus pelophilus TaxID=2823377 RepID=A0ABT3NBU1_9BACT|nr:nucleotidyltransferase domain-containing protein [Desulfobotulus pelophilus]MCW7754927.1 nucleotidyltransferase domain-containing protein [Desulfobotulus pelophilus]
MKDLQRKIIQQEDILNCMRDFKNRRQDEYFILKIGVFGSVARNDIKEESDIDVVVELKKPDLFSLIGIKQELEEHLHRKVDVVRYRQGMNAFLKTRIDREALYV